MTEEQQKAVQALVDGLAYFDLYDPVPSDDCPVNAENGECSYEFALEDGCLKVGHLRQLASIFTQES